MSMRHPKLQQWDETMKKMFDEIDDYLEEKYGHLYPLHPNREKPQTRSTTVFSMWVPPLPPASGVNWERAMLSISIW